MNEDSSSTADVADLKVSRNERGELLPVEQESEMFGTLKVIQMPYGEIQEKFGDAGDVAQAEASVVAEVIDNHLVEPDLSADAGGTVTDEYVEDELLPLVPREVLLAVLKASGVDADVAVDEGGSATVDLEGNPT